MARVEVGALNDIMEFDHVIRVNDDGTVTDVPGVWAPEVYWSDGEVTLADGWSLMDGYSGQDRYSGPVMHESEYIGGGMARDILDTPGVYVAVVVTDLNDYDYDNGDDGVVGWAVAVRAEVS